MAGLDFRHSGQGTEQEDPRIVARNARLGLRLFTVYVVCYVGYMVLSAFRPEWMKHEVLAGVNLAVVYGFGLIAAALVLALVYLNGCHKN
jgi:uncharacterized membrane protein (DUF485 family)